MLTRSVPATVSTGSQQAVMACIKRCCGDRQALPGNQTAAVSDGAGRSYPGTAGSINVPLVFQPLTGISLYIVVCCDIP